MSEPITWRNVTGPSLADASRPLAYASSTFTDGMGVLKSALAGYQTDQDKTWKQQDVDATNALRAQLYGAKTPEQLAALQESGALSQTVAANGARIDRAALDPLIDARPGVLQQQAKQTMEFQDYQRAQTDAPIAGQAKALIFQGKFNEAAPLMAQLSPQSQAAVANDLQAYKDQLVVRGQRDDKAKADLTHLTKQEEDWAASRRIQQQQAATAAGQLAVSQAQLGISREDHLQARLSAALDQYKKAGTTAGSQEGKDRIGTLIGTMFDKKTDAYGHNQATQVASKLSIDFPRATPEEIVDAVTATRNNTLNPFNNETKVDYSAAKKNLESTLASSNTANAKTAREELRASLAKNINDIEFKLGRKPTAFTSPVDETKPVVAGVPTPAQPTQPGAEATASSSFTPQQQAEYTQQLAERRAGVRKDFSPAIQKQLEADKAAGDKVTADREKLRAEVAKAAGLTPPPTPEEFIKSPTYMMAVGAGGNPSMLMEQAKKQYADFQAVVDRRIENAKKQR